MTENDNFSKPKPDRPQLTLGVDKYKSFSGLKAKSVTVEVKKKRVIRPHGMGYLGNDESADSSVNVVPQNSRLALLQRAVIDAHNEKIQKEEAASIEIERLKSEAIVNSTITEETEGLSEAPEPIPNLVIDSTDIKNDGLSKKDPKYKKAGDIEEGSKFGKKLDIKQTVNRLKPELGKRISKVNLQNIEREEERSRSFASIKRAREKARRALGHNNSQEAEKQIKEVILPEVITVADLASRMAERSTEVVRAFMKLGMIVNVNQTIDADTAELIIHEFGHKIKRVTDADIENILIDDIENPENFVSRPPVVTVMGHVDHGKTSLLDALRSTDVALHEAGGITQHIGAYQVKLETGELVTFIDTPGHKAFTAMRSRGAQATDIVILVVAADDGIKEQTIEAISHAKAADVPIIVAINKIDAPGADPQRVLTELLSYDLVPEAMGGNIMTIEVSALKRTNLDKLIEGVLLQAEMLDLKADPTTKARGVVIESKIDKLRGVVTTLLVQKGTLCIGDVLIAGAQSGRVRLMSDDKRRSLDAAGPSMPVEICGLDGSPEAGENFVVVTSERQARDISEYRLRRARDLRTSVASKGTLEELFAKASGTGKVRELPLIIKGDVNGSVEAIVGSLEKISTDEVKVKILHKAVGGINESDVSLAEASGALIVGFNVRANDQSKKLAAKSGIDIRYYSIIYNLLDDVKMMLSGMLSPSIREEFLGLVEIRKVYNITKSGKIAGSFVTDGMIKRGAKVRLLRDDIVIHEGHLKTLKRFKEDVKEVKAGYECGIAFENYEDIKENDKVEVFELIEEKRTLD
jgi:translation initiation factor IF-2